MHLNVQFHVFRIFIASIKMKKKKKKIIYRKKTQENLMFMKQNINNNIYKSFLQFYTLLTRTHLCILHYI